MAMVKLQCCSDPHMVADAEDEVHRVNFQLVQDVKHKDDSENKDKGSPLQANQLGHSFWVSKQGSLEGILSLKSFPISPLIRMILPAKITSSKLQNSSQRCKHLDLPHSLSPGTVVDGEFSPKRGLHYFHLLEYWSQGKGKEKVTNPHLLLESHN